MANVKINSIPSNKLQVVESITEAKQLERIDSGKVFVFDQAAYTVRLPKLSTDMAGWSCTMIRRTSADSNMPVTLHIDDEASTDKYAIEGFADGTDGDASDTEITITGHPFSDSDKVKVTGTSNYNGFYTIDQSDANTFDIEAAYVAESATGHVALASGKIKYIEFEGDDSTGSGYAREIIIEDSSTGGTAVCFLKFFTDGITWYAHLFGEGTNTFTSN